MKNENREKNRVFASVKKSLREHPVLLILVCVCIAGSVITSLLPPLILEKGVNILSEYKEISISLAVLYFVLIILSDLFESAQSVSITVLGQKITKGLRSSMCEKLDHLPTEYFYTHDSGRTGSVFVNDADTVDSLYTNGVIGMIADCFKIVSILVIIFTKSMGLGIILLIVTPFLFLLTRSFQKRTLSAQSDNRRAIAKVNNHVPETIRCIRMIHVFSREKWMEDKYDKYIEESYDAVNRSNIYDSIYSPIILIVQSAVIAVMMIFAAQGEGMQQLFGLSVGTAVAVIAYVGKIFSPLESLGMEIQNIQSAVSGIKRMNEFLSEEEWNPALTKKIIAEQAPAEKFSQTAVSFQNVTFGYNKQRTVLSGVSFEIAGGENVTFTGRTGSGKSTIFRLLTGLYEPESGTVRINGRDPVLIPEQERRRIFGVVSQKFAVVDGNLRDQLTLFDPEVTDEMIQRALELTGLSAVVAGFEKGLDTSMASAAFSQGQLQLLSIARAIVTSPDILFLDEITANLDSETEAQVITALKNASEGRTVLSISHRWSRALKEERTITVSA